AAVAALADGVAAAQPLAPRIRGQGAAYLPTLGSAEASARLGPAACASPGRRRALQPGYRWPAVSPPRADVPGSWDAARARDLYPRLRAERPAARPQPRHRAGVAPARLRGGRPGRVRLLRCAAHPRRAA